MCAGLFAFKLLCSLHFGLNFVRIHDFSTFLGSAASDFLFGEVSGAEELHFSSIKQAGRAKTVAFLLSYGIFREHSRGSA